MYFSFIIKKFNCLNVYFKFNCLNVYSNYKLIYPTFNKQATQRKKMRISLFSKLHCNLINVWHISTKYRLPFKINLINVWHISTKYRLPFKINLINFWHISAKNRLPFKIIF